MTAALNQDRGGFAGLDACVHCGFCLQACPTFLATGDEADGPRGRIELMRALERNELAATDASLQLHLDRCLGCRACEPVCPSGVAYGHGLEAARGRISDVRPPGWLTRAALWTLTTAGISRIVYLLARALRATGLPRSFAGWGRFRFAMGMLAATRPGERGNVGTFERKKSGSVPSVPPFQRSVVLFRGCVMDGLFSHVHEATVRVLEVNGFAVREVTGAGCCGALHAHAGLAPAARALAAANIAAFDGADTIVVNSAGCGALLRDYGHLMNHEPAAVTFAGRVRDVTEVLASRAGGIVPGAPLDRHVAYDPPCHLLHAQRVAEPPLRLFDAIPVLRLTRTPEADRCCGSAGLYTLVEPDMSRTVLAPKLDELRDAAPQVVATGNPGCAMQIGAGLAAGGLEIPVLHPVELLDQSYFAAGYYR
jgi:glycolate dehydrogenase iron-sulfur subunit